jgi:hypothetical protein
MNWIIYVLKHPRTKEIRYVGWTMRRAARRLTEHINKSLHQPRTHKDRWICSLFCLGLRPLLEVIEVGTGDGWAEAERRWIASHRAKGHRLVNDTVGGDGIPVWGTPEERSAVAKKREAAKTFEVRSSTRKKAQAGITPARRSEISRNRWARFSKQQRSEIATKREAAKTPEQRSASAKKGKANTTPEENSASQKKRLATRRLNMKSP